MKRANSIYVLYVGSVLWLLVTTSVYAGNINPDSDEHKYIYSENVGWSNLSPSEGNGVTVEDEKITGYLWSENIGWINFAPIHGGIAHDGRGNLSGYAWSENCGWINFSCTTNNSCSSVDYGVTIDTTTGLFSGYAWGENIGWVKFDYSGFPNPDDNYAITSWRMNGDINSDGVITLEDVIMTLQVCAGSDAASIAHYGADVNGDCRIGIAEATYVLNQVLEQ